MPATPGGLGRGTDWTYSQGYTGGDMQPIPVPSGGIVYTKYLRADDGTIHSQLWYINRPYPNTLYAGKALTSQGQDCRSPAFYPDFSWVAMICTYGKQESNLVIAPFTTSGLGPMKTVIADQMVAQPVWAPDGSGLAYLAPAVPDMPFQLWFLPRAAMFPPTPSPAPAGSPVAGAPATPSPSVLPSPSKALPVKPIQLTVSVGLDATSTMAWAA